MRLERVLAGSAAISLGILLLDEVPVDVTWKDALVKKVSRLRIFRILQHVQRVRSG